MEERKLKVVVGKPGGNAGMNSVNFKMTIPTAFAKGIGITKEDREVIVQYDEEKKTITIKKESV